MKNNKKISILSLVLFILFVAVSCKEPIPTPDKEFINISASLDFPKSRGEQSLDVSTNAANIDVTVSPGTWCQAIYSNGLLKVTVDPNSTSSKRTTIITLKGETARKNVYVNQDGRILNIGSIEKDVKVAVSSATASSSQPGEGIENTYDNDYNTIYHSAYSGNNLPVTLTYNFDNVPTLDYLVCYPRSGGGNGAFEEIEVYYATKSNSTLTMAKKVNLLGNSSPARITFDESIIEPTKIQIKVLSGVNNFASCAEIEFFRKNDNAFDFLSIFTDSSCSEVKSGITEDQLNAIPNEFFKQLALEIYKDEYDKTFRINTYQCYQHPDVMAAVNKTSTYGLHDNPTGIYAAKANDEIVVFVGDTHGENISLFIQNPDAKIDGNYYPLSQGFNSFKAPFAGLMYVMYYTKSTAVTGEDIKVNIVTGEVNGYFDNSIHTTKADWDRLISEARFRHFDMKGRYATMTFETEGFRTYTPDGLALINLYDELVYQQQKFMGLEKYNKMFKNRSHFQVVYGDAFMYASGYHTGYNAYTQETVLNVDGLLAKGMDYSEAAWGPAHELGHTHQTRPGLKWVGMAEVTNNIHSAYIQTKWTGKCRLQEESMMGDGGYVNRYEKAFDQIKARGIPHNSHDDPFCKLIPFWQLKLYMHDVLKKTDFYPDIYEMVRVSPDINDHGAMQLRFVEFACDASKLDLIDFFDKWGFFKTIDVIIDDYGKQRFLVTQEMINATKERIRAKGYLKPNSDFSDITDNTVNR